MLLHKNWITGKVLEDHEYQVLNWFVKHLYYLINAKDSVTEFKKLIDKRQAKQAIEDSKYRIPSCQTVITPTQYERRIRDKAALDPELSMRQRIALEQAKRATNKPTGYVGKGLRNQTQTNYRDTNDFAVSPTPAPLAYFSTDELLNGLQVEDPTPKYQSSIDPVDFGGGHSGGGGATDSWSSSHTSHHDTSSTYDSSDSSSSYSDSSDSSSSSD
jgi:hypothetical protein